MSRPNQKSFGPNTSSSAQREDKMCSLSYLWREWSLAENFLERNFNTADSLNFFWYWSQSLIESKFMQIQTSYRHF